jgi:hypothetical protein
MIQNLWLRLSLLSRLAEDGIEARFLCNDQFLSKKYIIRAEANGHYNIWDPPNKDICTVALEDPGESEEVFYGYAEMGHLFVLAVKSLPTLQRRLEKHNGVWRRIVFD